MSVVCSRGRAGGGGGFSPGLGPCLFHLHVASLATFEPARQISRAAPLPPAPQHDVMVSACRHVGGCWLGLFLQFVLARCSLNVRMAVHNRMSLQTELALHVRSCVPLASKNWRILYFLLYFQCSPSHSYVQFSAYRVFVSGKLAKPQTHPTEKGWLRENKTNRLTNYVQLL